MEDVLLENEAPIQSIEVDSLVITLPSTDHGRG